MSKKQLVNTIVQELGQLNERIDMKIIRGISYNRDAARHKALLSQFRRAHRENRIFGFLNLL